MNWPCFEFYLHETIYMKALVVDLAIEQLRSFSFVLMLQWLTAMISLRKDCVCVADSGIQLDYAAGIHFHIRNLFQRWNWHRLPINRHPIFRTDCSWHVSTQGKTIINCSWGTYCYKGCIELFLEWLNVCDVRLNEGTKWLTDHQAAFKSATHVIQASVEIRKSTCCTTWISYRLQWHK